MIDTFPDRLLDAIDRAGAPVCVGIDPVIDQLPPQVLKKIDPRLDEHEAAIDAIFDFVTTLLRVVAPLVPAVAILHFLTALATARTMMRRFSFAWSLAEETLRLTDASPCFANYATFEYQRMASYFPQKRQASRR